MQHRTVHDLMTRGVVHVHRDTPFKEIAELLAEHDVTALPVVDDDRHPIGVVSEADLLEKQAGRPDPYGLLPDREGEPGRRPPDDAATAYDLMTSPPVLARPEWNMVGTARVMKDRHVKRLPVVDEADRLVGIISRSDLLRVFLRQDAAIREEIVRDVLEGTVGLAPGQVTAEVADGCVTLSGDVGTGSLVPVVERLCQGVDGVVKVRNHLAGRSEETQGTALP